MKRTREEGSEAGGSSEGALIRRAAGGFGRVEGVDLESRKAYLALQLTQVTTERGRTERARAANIGKNSDFFKCVPCMPAWPLELCAPGCPQAIYPRAFGF